MKKIKLLLVGYLLICLFGCTEKKANVINIATEGTWAPYTYTDENGKLIGYDVEVCRAICEKLGYEANFVTGDYDGFLIGLENGVYHTIANCVDITKEREEKYDFSIPYINSEVVLIVSESNTNIKSFDDLKDKVTTNTITSSYAQVAEEYGATVTPATTFEETISLLLNGRAEATINSKASLEDYLKIHPETKVKIVDSFISKAGFPFTKGSSLKAEFDRALEELIADGTITQLSIKYFNEDISGK